MQRDMDLVRDILLKIDAAASPLDMTDLLAGDASNEDLAKVQYHLAMLIDEAHFVSGIKAHTLAGKNWIQLNLTWTGHEFLENIRSPELWRKTKAGAAKVGSTSIDVITEIAKAVVKAQIVKLTGGALDL